MKKLIVLLLVLGLSGCATYTAVTSSPLLEASIRVTVRRVLENNASYVLPAYKYTTMALQLVRGQDIGSLGALDDLFLQVIKDDLLPEEQDMALSLFSSIKGAILADLEQRGITNPEDQKIYIVQALTWINQSASIRL